MTVPDQIARKANRVVETLTHTQYQHAETIEVGAGIYDCDCNGFVGFILQDVAPADYHLVPKEPTQPRPRAFNYYDYFASLDPAATQGWRRIDTLTGTIPGDVIAWRFATIEADENTGHGMIVADLPAAIGADIYSVRVYDSAATPHFDDTRGTAPGQFPNGVGAGRIHFRIDGEGRPIAFLFGPPTTGEFAYLPIAIGRASPIQVANPEPTMTNTSDTGTPSTASNTATPTAASGSGTVLDTLRPDAPLRAEVSAALNAALKTQLAAAASAAKFPVLVGLINAMPAADLAAAKDMSLQGFALRQIDPMVANDPAMQAAVNNELARLSTTATVGGLLGLDQSAAANPIVAPQVNKAALSSLVATAPTLAANSRLIDDFTQRYAAATGSLSAFWASLAQDVEFAAAVPALQLGLQLGAVTLGVPAMVAALRARLPAMTSPQDLVTLSAADIEGLITANAIPIPASITGATAAAKAANYAAAIVGTLTEAYPSAFFLQHLRVALAGSDAATNRAVVSFLDNATTFDLLNSNLATYLAANEATVFAGIAPAEQTLVTRQLAKWQRIARVQPDYQVANILVNQGFSSAAAIARMPRGSFLSQLTAPLGSVTQATAVYDSAQQIAARTSALFVNVRQALSMNATRAMGDVSANLGQILTLGTQSQAPVSGLADWQTLFGGTSYCACSDCRSIYSAAAYFVDLMQYLQGHAGNSAGRTPFDVLVSRRPDLPYIKLNCANTDTELPYVDLVNEILEGFVALQGHLDMSVAHDTPRDATPAELAVSPEYTNDTPYNNALFTAVYPPTLPFDRWLETARVYLQFAGSSLWQVMAACHTGVAPVRYSYSPLAALPAGIQLPPFIRYDPAQQTLSIAGRMTSAAEAALLALSPAVPYQGAVSGLYAASQADLVRGSPTTLAVACESLGISNQECIILTGRDVTGQPPATPASLADFYGDPTSLNGVWNVESFIQTLQISYADLVSLLETRFLNPQQTVVIEAPSQAPCDISQMTLIDMSVSGGLLQTVTLDRLHRFIRLWKKLGWKTAELDKTITALQAADIDQGFLAAVSAVTQLQSALGLSVTEILSFWAELDTDGKGCLYLTLFQNKTAYKPVDPAFTLRYFATLAGLPLLQFPSPLFPNLSYDAANQFLLFSGSLAPAEYQALGQLSPDPAYQAAILTPTGLGFGIAPLAALPQVSSTYLYNLGVEFGLVIPIVSYVGAMPDDVRNLLNVSSDPFYQTAIDNLYAQRTLSPAFLAGDPAAPGLSDHLPALLAALQLTAQDLALLRAYTGLADTAVPPPGVLLTLANVSTLARYAILSRALSLGMTDFIAAIGLIGFDPFERGDPRSTLGFVRAVTAITASPFSIAQLNYLYLDQVNPNAGIAPLPANVTLLLTSLQMGLASIAQANAPVPDPKGAALMKNLGTVLGASVAGVALGLIDGSSVFSSPLASMPAMTLPSFVSYAAGKLGLTAPGAMTAAQLAGLAALSSDSGYLAAINTLFTESLAGGTTTYTTPLAAVPPIAFPASLGGAVSYDAAAQQLRCMGPLGTAALGILLGLSADPAYQAAATALRAQQVSFITLNFQPFLSDTATAATTLLDNPAGLSLAQKVAYVAQYLMAYLTQVQSESLITQTLCGNLSLDTRIGGVLLNSVLKSIVAPAAGTAMADYLALVGDGLLGAYFPTLDLSGPPALTRVDSMVDFDFGFGLPDPSIAARPFSVRWTGWVMPQYSELYSFFVLAGDGARLVVNAQTLIGPWSGVDAVIAEASGSIQLTAGTLYSIELDWYDQTAAGQIVLSWSSPSTPKAAIPQTQLFSGASLQSLAPVIASYTRLFKTALLVTGFALTPMDLDYLYANGTAFAGVDPNDPTNAALDVPFDPNLLPLTIPATYSGAVFDQWLRLNAFVGLRSLLPGGDAGLLQVFTTAAAGAASTPLPVTDPLAALIATVTGWSVTDIVFLAGSSGFGLTYADFVNERGTGGTGLVRLQSCAALLARLGISAAQLFSWSGFGSAAATEEAIAADIQKTFKARYDDATWVTVGTPLNDKVRAASKDALIAYILGKSSAWSLMTPDDATPIISAVQLYEFFLIDVQMSTCMLTSRIVQANAAIQLFVERCLMDLEDAVPGYTVSPSVFDPTYWENIKNFRVWQAARMVYIQPEDYMIPELRDDKTPIFEDFEAFLQQGAATNDVMQQAYINYLTELSTVARLDVRASFWQLDPNSTSAPDGTQDASNDVLHVFARTMTKPYAYYYRRLLNCSQYVTGTGAVWTPWELVDTGIQADHLVPVVWDGRLFIFWPAFSETADPLAQTAPIPPAQANIGYQPPPPVIDIGLSLSWSVYSQGSWSSAQTSDPVTFYNFSQTFGQGATFDPSVFIINAVISDQDQLTINVYISDITTQTGIQVNSQGLVASFAFSQCGSMPDGETVTDYVPAPVDPGGGVEPFYPMVPELTPPNVTSSYNALEGNTNLILSIGPIWPLSGVTQIEVLSNTPAYELVFPQQFFDLFGLIPPPPFNDQPFFYQDSQRVYFVTQSGPSLSDQVTNADVEGQFYLRSSMSAAAQTIAADIIFPGTTAVPAATGMIRPAATAVATSPAAAPSVPVVSDAALPTAPTPLPNAVEFSVFYHPFACAFLKEVDRYGVPQLLTLANQASSNDNGVLGGFIISPVEGNPAQLPSVSLSPGVLVYQDSLGQSHLYETTLSTAVSAPTSVVDYLYYDATGGFQYSTLAPGSLPADAYIGVLTSSFGPWISSGPTVFEAVYNPQSCVPESSYPFENVDFSFSGAYAVYNWELFFHMPLMIATRLSQNQQFQDADNWLRYIFNPTSNASDPAPQRYWVCLPFAECAPWDEVNGQIMNLLYPQGAGTTPPVCGQSVADQVSAWASNPFDPFMIGRMRTIAFRMKVVMAYFDNQLAWGDYLFAQNTRESINEATLHYVRVQELLGPRPAQIPPRGVVQDYSYNDLVTLYGLEADNLNDPLVLIENNFPYVTGSSNNGSPGLPAALSMSTTTPYFCLPPNDTLLGYWDTVADRLYKIRHCMNIAGVVEQLPLFSPPISPALLVAAAAAGVDISSVVANTSASVGYYRFKVLIQKALELCSEVQSLGGAILAALEKQDAESLALLRATQETNVLQVTQQMKAAAVAEAQSEIAALNASLTAATLRNSYYQGLVAGQLLTLESQQLAALQSAAKYQSSALTSLGSVAFDSMVPNFQLGIQGFGGSPTATFSGGFGGSVMAAIDNATAGQAQTNAGIQGNQANGLGLQAQWQRRSLDWQFQAQLASDDMAQIQAQITAATYRLTIAEDDQQSFALQLQNAQNVQSFLTGKYTNVQLYSWMVDQISTVFFQCYQLAYDLATRAEAAYRFERCLTSSSYIQFGYWDSLKKGLLSGERLYTDIKRLEIAYLESDLREYEISKSISLVLFDPWALINLKQTGQCFLNLPESFFDMDYPGHYFRRLRSVSLTIPCVTGPYTSVNCTLTLLNSRIRVDSTAGKQDYSRDAHFITNFAATQSIATSTAQNDSGMFEVNFQDDRYLPFEGAGLISTWQVDLPVDCNDFDFDTITDVVINLRYTSRYGGDALRDVAKQLAVLPPRPVQSYSGSTQPFPAHQPNLQRMFSLRHEFPTEWYRFLNPAAGATVQTMQLALGNERFPYQYRSKKIQIVSVEFVLVPHAWATPPTPVLTLSTTTGANAASVTLSVNAARLAGAPYGVVLQPPPLVRPGPTAPPTWRLQTSSQLSSADVEDVFVICNFST